MDSSTRRDRYMDDSHTTVRPNITEDGYKIVDCRGLKLLGIPNNQVLYVCVHEISMALWKSFDTPRVSVQKKITDLGIHLLQTTKSQVVILRREGIIGNFRATMITLRDAEKLYDALEHSRRKRGLVKHILKEPLKRATRAEEYGAKKLSMTPLYKKRPDTAPNLNANSVSDCSTTLSVKPATLASHPYRTHGSTLHTPHRTVPRDSPYTYTPQGCALNGTSEPQRNLNRVEEDDEELLYGGGSGIRGLQFDVLFCAEDPVLAGGAGCRDHYIELLPNAVGNRRGIRPAQTGNQELSEVCIQSHMERVTHQQQMQRLLHKDKSLLTKTPNQTIQRNPTQSAGRRKSNKPEDPDYVPSSYAAKSSQHLVCSAPAKRSSRNKDRDSLLAVPSTSTARPNSLRSRHLSSPPLELNELEEEESVHSGVSGNSSWLQSSTPERFLVLDESSNEEEEVEEEREQGNSDIDSVFIFEHSPSPDMRITVPGKGVTGTDRRVVKTKLRHFAHTTSPQFTALSRGKRLPLTASDSPPISPSTLSPLMVSISLTELKPQQPGTVQSTAAAAPPPLPSSMRKKRGRPSNKVRPTALSSFVMKKRPSSPSTLSDGGSPCPPPPPAKRSRVGSESEPPTADVKSSTEVDSNLLPQHNLQHSRLSDPLDIDDACGRTGTPLQPAQHQRLEVPASQQNQGTTSQGNKNGANGVHVGANGVHVGADGRGGGESMGSPYTPDDDQLSVTSSSTTSTTTTNHTSLPAMTTIKTKGKAKAQLSVTTNSNGVTKRGRPTRSSCNNGFSLSNELKSLMSTSESTFNFNQLFSYYPPKLVVKDGELLPERSLSVKRVDRTNVGNLPENHPFLAWNLGQPAKGTVTLRRKKRKPPKAVCIT